MNGIPESQMLPFAPDVIALIGTGAAKIIPLTQGQVAVVDAEDYDWLSQWKWYSKKHQDTFYAQCHAWIRGRRVCLLMHREILGYLFKDGKWGDHKDRNGLNNLRANLREITHNLNRHNSKLNRDNKSGYRGVHWCRTCKKWVVMATVNGRQKTLGRFSDLLIAAKVYDTAVIARWGIDAVINFPQEN